MIKKILFLLGFVGLASTAYSANYWRIHNSNVLFSPSISGTHLSMLNACICTNQPIYMLKPRGKPVCYHELHNRLGFSFEPGVKPFYHTHMPEHIPKINPRTNKLILVIRNYKEWFLRYEKAKQLRDHRKPVNPLAILHSKALKQEYYSYLRKFDNWPEKSRLIIYYEELTGKPRETLFKLAQFLGCEGNLTSATVERFMRLKENLGGFYNQKLRVFGGSRSDRTGRTFYTKDFPKAELQKVDREMRAIFPYLYDIYLKQYAE